MTDEALARQLAALRRRQRLLEDRHAESVVDLLYALRTDILTAIVTQPGTWRAYQLQQLLALVESLVLARGGEASAVVARYLPEALTLGAEQASIGIGARAASLGLLNISAALVDAVVETTQAQVQTVWAELGAELQHSIRRVVLGVQRPDDAIAALVPRVRDAKSFGSAAARADTIVRAETNRAFSLAAEQRLRETHAALGDIVRKRWVSFTDEKTRRSHAEAGRRYGFEGVALPVDALFEVGSARLRYPLDPEGPAAEVINCRCRLVAVIIEEN
jgi:hypothetical protein